ncbi:MAG: dockerin type I repeat-containing protein [Muribaculaceae bacterium]|nr:dockerin type I repeat-containing protein [Muribaculaceae bacterium]
MNVITKPYQYFRLDIHEICGVEQNGKHTFQLAEFQFTGKSVSKATQGDVNGDGIVSGADVTALYNVLLDNATPAGDADVNEDGVVSGADVTALYNILLGD